MTRLPHVEGTCPHGTSFLLGHRLLGDAHLILDVVDGVGEHLRRFIGLAESVHLLCVNSLLTHLVIDCMLLTLQLERGPTSTVMKRFATSRFCEDVCNRCDQLFRYVCRYRCRCSCSCRCTWMCTCRYWLRFTSWHRSNALKVNGWQRHWAMGVSVYVIVSQVFAAYLHGVARASDVAILVAILDWDQNWLHNVPSCG